MATKVDRELFQKLASDFEEERIQTTIEIIQSLNNIKKTDGELLTSELEYSINRLIKSLSTNKRFSRLGYSVCLGEVLNLQLLNVQEESDVNTQDFLSNFFTQLSKELVLNEDGSKKEQNKKIKGKEERGNAFGRLFGLQVLSNPPLFEIVFIEKKGQKVNLKVAETYIKQLYLLSKYKSWISEAALFAILEFVDKILSQQTLSQKYVVKFKTFVIELLDKLDLTMTLEGLSIYLKLIYAHDDLEENIKILKTVRCENLHWEQNDPLLKANSSFLLKVLKGMEASKGEDETTSFENKNNGFWNPRLHFGYTTIIDQLNVLEENKDDSKTTNKKTKLNNGTAEISSRFTLKDFSIKVIDQIFFAEKSSTERKYIGFEMVKHFIAIDSSAVNDIFTLKNFKRVFTNQISNKDRLLHKQASTFVIAALEYFESHPENILSCLLQLWEVEYGDEFLNFDNLTKTKFCFDLLSSKGMTSEQKLDISKTLINICESSALKNTDTSIKKYKFCIDQLLYFLKHQKETIDTKDSNNWANYSLHKLCCLSFFKTETELAVSEEDFDFDDEDENSIHYIAGERLYSIIGELLSNNQLDILSKVLQFVIKNESDEKLLFKLDPDLLNVKLESISTLVDLKQLALEASDEKKCFLQSVAILFQTLLLQVFSGNPDSLQLLEDLLIFYQSVIINKENKSWNGIIEIYLVLLSQSKMFLRKIVTCSFTNLASGFAKEDINFFASAINPFFDVLKARENKSGFEHLFQGGEVEENADEKNLENSDESEEDMEIDVDEMSEVEFDGMSDESDDEVNKIEKETTSALVKALNLPKNMIDDKGNVNHDISIDADDSDDSIQQDDDSEEELLDDEKMMQLNSTLSNIFKHRKEALASIHTGNKRKIEVKNARETVITLKNRVVDLLEQYIKAQEGIINTISTSLESKKLAIESVLILIVPLIECIRTTTNKALSDKIAKIIKTRAMKLKMQNCPKSAELVDLIAASMSNLHKLVLTEKPGLYSKLFYNITSTCSLLHCKLIWTCNNEEDYKSIEKINLFYNEVMKEWISKPEIKLTNAFFVDFINWANSKRQQ